MMNLRGFSAFAGAATIVVALPVRVQADVGRQPLIAQAWRVASALDRLGEPLQPAERVALKRADAMDTDATAVAAVEQALDPRCLFTVTINPEMRVTVARGAAAPVLVQGGWRVYLVKVSNQAGATAILRAYSPDARSLHDSPAARTGSDRVLDEADSGPADAAWLDLQAFDDRPLEPALGGLPIEYRVIQLYSRDAGRREATFAFDVGPGTRDAGARGETSVLFRCLPAHEITLHLKEAGKPATGALVIRDQQARVYPATAKRLAPDFPFQPQIYRDDGDAIRLPDGTYTIEFRRGPESIPERRQVIVDARTRDLSFEVRRWIDPSTYGWWSGDHHLHAAGCSQYSRPTEGVRPRDMALHCRGEDLKVGAVLTWGPGFDYQKQFFCGGEDASSVPPYLIRYDVEVSGFGSYKSGHLCLLRLRDQVYPGSKSTEGWPTLGMNTIRWAKAQDAVVGTAHSGWGLQPVAPGDTMLSGPSRAAQARVITEDVPNYIVPPFNGIGANEYIVDVTHEVPGGDGRPVPAVDFVALGDTPYPWELNIWYHTLNAGFRTRASGETDFPCIYDERVGMARSYVKVDGPLTYNRWCEGLRAGRCYVSDGFSHLLDFTVDGRELGVEESEVDLGGPRDVVATARVAAYLPETPDAALAANPVNARPYWNIERARIGTSRAVPAELVVNGVVAARRSIVADGSLHDVAFTVNVRRSSWIALRVLGSSHTNPIFVLVGRKPVRASRRSVQWCLDGVDRCWSQKERFIAPGERAQARRDYEHARMVYRRRLTECDVE